MTRVFDWKSNPKNSLAAILWAILFLTSPAWASLHASPGSSQASLGSTVKIRVRLTDGMARVKVRGYDLRIFASGSAKPAVSADRMSEWEFHCKKTSFGPVIQGQSGSTRGASARTVSFRDSLRIESLAGFLTFEARPYREELVIHVGGTVSNPVCEVVNHVDIERYLDGLVNSEFSSKWNDQAVEAQVIAARTYAFHQMGTARALRKLHYDVDATTRDQVYDGSIREDWLASRVVERSRGMILRAAGRRPAGESNMMPIKAFYHSTCGGMTETPEKVWGGRHAGFRRAVPCRWCAGSPRFLWELDLRNAEIASAILQGIHASPGSLPASPGSTEALRHGELAGMSVIQTDSSGRAEKIMTRWRKPNGTPGHVELVVSGTQLRQWLGATRMRSTVLQISSNAQGKWQLRGRGNGHGVGMCQWGAKVMGETGFKTAAILKHYYPDAVLTRAW